MDLLGGGGVCRQRRVTIPLVLCVSLCMCSHLFHLRQGQERLHPSGTHPLLLYSYYSFTYPLLCTNATDSHLPPTLVSLNLLEWSEINPMNQTIKGPPLSHLINNHRFDATAGGLGDVREADQCRGLRRGLPCQPGRGLGQAAEGVQQGREGTRHTEMREGGVGGTKEKRREKRRERR